jgi:hypothetical protein
MQVRLAEVISERDELKRQNTVLAEELAMVSGIVERLQADLKWEEPPHHITHS